MDYNSPTMNQIGGSQEDTPAKIINADNVGKYDTSTLDRSGSHRNNIYASLGGGKSAKALIKSKKQSEISPVKNSFLLQQQYQYDQQQQL